MTLASEAIIDSLQKIPRRVALVSAQFPPFASNMPVARGGAEREMESIAASLRAVGTEVLVISQYLWRRSGDQEAPGVVRIRVYRPYSFISNPFVRIVVFFAFEFFNPIALLRCFVILARFRPDAIIMGPTTQMSPAPHMAATILRVPLVARYDWNCFTYPYPQACTPEFRANNCARHIAANTGLTAPTFANFMLGSVTNVYALFKAWIWRNALLILALNDLYRDLFNAYGVPAHRVKVVAPSSSMIVNGETSYSQRDTPPFTIAFIGRLSQEKGILLFLEAVRRFRGRTDIRVEIAGDGPLKTHVVESLKDVKNVIYRGWLQDQDLRDLYRRASIVAFPSIVPEGHPLVVDEALRYGCEVVAFKISGVERLLGRSTIVETSSGADLANALERVLARISPPGGLSPW